MKELTPELLKKSLLDSIDHLLESKENYLVNPDTAFSRIQKISFRDTMIFPIVAANESIPIEILDFFPASNLPKSSAMDYRREQIHLSAYKDLLTHFNQKLPTTKAFKGMKLIACDGTRINTPYNPRDSDSFVKAIENRRGFNQYHLNTFCDLLNDRFVDLVIQGYSSMNEKSAFCEMIDRYPKDNPSIFTADRGYASFNVIAHTINNGHYFVFRLTNSMAINMFDNSEELSASDEFDVEGCINIGRIRTKVTSATENYHYIGTSKTYDYITTKSNEIDTFSVREIKFILPGGNAEYLLTNLPKSEFSTSDIREIYRLRWGIETSFRYLKYVSGMIHLHSLKQKFIFQEIYAKLIGYNFCAALLAYTKCKNTEKTKYTYTIDKTYLFKACIRFLRGKIKNILPLIEKMKEPVREGRKFDRVIRRQHADPLQYR